jgi:carbon-monoxide dehydrogenase large subunit
MTDTTITTIGAGTFVGKPVRRVEDEHLLRGAGTYIDNLVFEDVLHLAFVRSPIAHARLEGIDTAAARAMPGVVAVYTGADLGVTPFAALMQVNPLVTRPPLATDVVRFVGDMVVAVVATSKAEAIDAAEMVEVTYDPLPAVVSMEAALAPDAPVLFDAVGSNIMMGNRARASIDPLADAEVVVRGRFENQRVAVAPIEGGAYVAVPGPDDDGHDLTVFVSCQMPHMVRGTIAKMFGFEPAHVRVVAPDVGGAFGGKHFSAEGAVVVKVALELGRPVKWVETRSENMTGMPHGRGQVQYVELGLRRDGTMVGMRCHVIGDGGGYAGFGGTLASGPTRNMASGVYRIPKVAYSVAVVTTNTTPMGAYRGAGRPEAASLIERIVDIAADELGIDPIELRRRNFVAPEDFPFLNPAGLTYDSGDYDAALTEVLRLADYDALRAEQAQRRDRGDRHQLGIGVSVYVEVTASGARTEFAAVEVHADGSATVKAGTSAHGQGHATTFSQIAAEQLGIPIEQIRFVQSDTALVARGGGTGGSRSLQLGGTAVLQASQVVLDKARHLAAQLLEAAPEDIVVDGAGRFGVAGVPSRALAWGELATAALAQDEPLAVELDSEAQAGPTFPFGAHVAVVEIDMETGYVTPVRHIAVDDCGRIINPMLVDGQVHGGLASGISQALWEEFVYDEDGNPLTSTFADYGLPSAAELPSFETGHTETPSPHNPLGAKGIGESATTGSTVAVQNAVVDALSHLGVRHIDIPCTPERVWNTIRDAAAGRLASPWRDVPEAFATLPGGDEPAEDKDVPDL